MIYVNNKPVEFVKFPSGETHLRDPYLATVNSPLVTLKFQSNDDMVNIMLLDNLFQQKGIVYSLEVPYLPSSRQDRVDVIESFSVEVYMSILRNLSMVDRIYYTDPHSPVAPTLLGSKSKETKPNINSILSQWDNYTLVAPDLGAVKRVQQYAEGANILIADKVRDYSTGQITSTRLLNPEDVKHTSKFVVIDDICDGGRTFIELAKVLKSKYKYSDLHLIVTHGFFTKGLEPLYQSGYNTVHYTNDMQRKD